MFKDKFTKLGKLNGEVYKIIPPSSESSTAKFTLGKLSQGQGSGVTGRKDLRILAEVLGGVLQDAAVLPDGGKHHSAVRAELLCGILQNTGVLSNGLDHELPVTSEAKAGIHSSASEGFDGLVEDLAVIKDLLAECVLQGASPVLHSMHHHVAI